MVNWQLKVVKFQSFTYKYNYNVNREAMRRTKNSELYLKIYFNSGGSMTNYGHY